MQSDNYYFSDYSSNNEPNILVDGSGNMYTVLTLSHWPRSPTPKELKADLSTEIVFNYLEKPEFHVTERAVTNNHFDEDGLLGIFSLIKPDFALDHKKLLIDCASVGDFEKYSSQEAMKIVFTIRDKVNKAKAQTDPAIFKATTSDKQYRYFLDIIPDIIENIDSYSDHWRNQFNLEQELEHFVSTDNVSIQNFDRYDLTVIELLSNDHSIEKCRLLPYLLAFNTKVNNYRVLVKQDQQYRFYYRYESWVEVVSSKPFPRINLTDLCSSLNEHEKNLIWKFNDWDELYTKRNKKSDLSLEDLLQQVFNFFDQNKRPWNPWA